MIKDKKVPLRKWNKTLKSLFASLLLFSLFFPTLPSSPPFFLLAISRRVPSHQSSSAEGFFLLKAVFTATVACWGGSGSGFLLSLLFAFARKEPEFGVHVCVCVCVPTRVNLDRTLQL